MSNLRETFIHKIRSAMQQTGFSVQDLANQLEVPYTTLQGWLSADKFPRPETYDRVMEILSAIETPSDPKPSAPGLKDEITLAVRKSWNPANLIGVVRITPEAEIELLNLSEKTGLSKREIASSLITQAAKIVKIVPDDI